MSDDTRDFWMGAASFVGLCLIAIVVIWCVVWADRYFSFEHTHDHAHPHEHAHEHEAHEHPHDWPAHEHSHTHKVEAGG